MQKWEYLTLEVSRNYGKTKYIVNSEQQPDLTNEKLAIVLNKIGRQGWELVGMTDAGEGNSFVFKRVYVKTTGSLQPERAADTNGKLD